MLKVSNREIVQAYLKHKNLKNAAVELQASPQAVGARLRRLRKVGVAVPKYGYSSITPEEITELNEIVRTLQ